jgi:hypothetical protein
MKSFFTVITLVFGVTVLGGYVYTANQGQVIGSPRERFVPKEVRAAPNGYRSFHFWHVGYGGYRGGK